MNQEDESPSAGTGAGTRPCELGAVEARDAIATGELTATALLEDCISQITALNPIVNCLVNSDLAAARETAATADARVAEGAGTGPLHGVPIAIKDIQDVAGLPTTWGSPELEHAVAVDDSPIVARVRRAGAVIIGKTNVPQNSIGANTVNPLFGATGNPYAPERTCGGSSGGSAVALATRMAPLATGSDHGGSLRIPACYSGVVGMRPTPGIVPNEQRGFPQTNYAVQGPMGRSVADVALLLSVIAERDTASRRDPMVFPYDTGQLAGLPAVDLTKLRVGYSSDLGGVLVSAEVKQQFAERIERIRQLLPNCASASLNLQRAPGVDWHLRQELFAAAYADTAESWNELGRVVNPNVRATYESAIATPMQHIAGAKKLQLELIRHTAAQFDDFDVLITPGVSIPPFPWQQLNPATIDGKPVENYMAWLELTAAFSVVGHPVVTLPCGLDNQGMPFGIQLIGPMYHDRQLLGVARALEVAFAQHRELSAPHPDYSWLAQQNAHCRTLGKEVRA